MANVIGKTVRFAEAFKATFVGKYKQSMAAPLVSEQLAVDPELLGESRVAGIRQHIKKQAVRMGGFEDQRLNQKHRVSNLPEDKQIARLDHELAHTQQELEFIKKLSWPTGRRPTGDVEATIIALSCSKPPRGCSRWTLRLLEEKVVELGIVPQISANTIGRLLKKHHLNLT